MSLSLGQSESYMNKTENGRMLPFMTGFTYISEYWGIAPGEFFGTGTVAPQVSEEFLSALENLTPPMRNTSSGSSWTLEKSGSASILR